MLQACLVTPMTSLQLVTNLAVEQERQTAGHPSTKGRKVNHLSKCLEYMILV
jgi:hypothetical protein